MATPKTKAASKAAPQAKPASQATHPQAGQTTRETTVVPPQGGDPIAKALIVTAKAEGFRRAGRPWSAMPETVDVDDFTADQVKALLAEPMLEVVVVAG